ncbi:class I SAM-dependent RNA methyltransferase [Mesobacterium pallidum]|uniref:class I SAM-dependent RNA methyltransferase n=1 Tax=Mesobacterium pallidum TaxID=2872037 RepID=UPI001EE33D5C
MTQYRIHRLGHHGDGIADGPIFAPLTLPGEEVTGEADGSRLHDVKIVTPSDDRVKPPCPHFRSCGGCQLQHASDDFVAGWKVDVVRQALQAQGLEADFRPILTSPPFSRRRAAFSARRTKKGVQVGFHGRASGVIVPIETCHLLHPDLLAARDVVAEFAMMGGSRKGEITALVTLSLDGLDLSVTGGKPLDGPLESSLAQLAGQRGVSRLAWDGEVIALRTPPRQVFGAAHVAPPPGAFLQATRQGESALLYAVTEAVGDAKQVVDLFAGCGTFALPLAERAEVHAVEGEAAMMQALDLGWRNAKGLKKVTHETRDLFRRPLLPDELKRFDAAVIDPPRAGAQAQVTELAEARVPVIAFVSCNPVTFARDAAILTQAGYAMDWVQVVDQFRWSVHIELAARFSLAR